MNAITRWTLTLTILCLPATGALAAGKYTGTTEPGVGAAAGERIVFAPAASRAVEVDTTAVDMLRDATAEDLTPAQMVQLAREVKRMDALRAKMESDGDLSDRDAQNLYRNTVKACQKVMTPTEIRPTVRAASVNGGRNGRERGH